MQVRDKIEVVANIDGETAIAWIEEIRVCRDGIRVYARKNDGWAKWYEKNDKGEWRGAKRHEKFWR